MTIGAVTFCRDARIRQRLTAALPQADLDQVSLTVSRPAQLIRTLPAAADRASLVDPSLPPVVVVPDAEMSLPHILSAVENMQHQGYLLHMPPQKHLAQLRSVSSLATLWCAAIRSKIPSGPVVLVGIGAGGVVAHEMAVQMQRSGQQVGAVCQTVWHTLFGQQSGCILLHRPLSTLQTQGLRGSW